MKNLTSPRILVAALALSLGLAANSFAMPRGEQPGPGMGMQGHHAKYHGQAMTRLHDDLKLDAKQEALWKEADKFAQEHRDTMRGQFQKHHAEIKTMLDQPGADLRAVTKRMDDLKAEGMKQREAVRDRWLAVYDSLNPEQKEKARLFIKAGMERTERMGQKRNDRQEHKGRAQTPRDMPAAPKN